MQPDEVVSVDISVTRVEKRPIRLIVITLINIVVGLVSIVAVVLLLTSPSVPAEVIPSYASAVFSVLVATTMIVSSLLALIGLPSARWPALVTALIFFGLLLLQTLFAAIDPQSVVGEMPTDRVLRKLWTGVVRNAIEIGLTLWAFLSAKTRAFFESRRAEA